MKIQKSSIPYILLLLGLLIGTPILDYFIQKKEESKITTIIIQEEGLLSAQESTAP